MKHCILSLSGGLDSSTLLLHLLEQGVNVVCLSFDYGQKHKVELERATDLVNYLNRPINRFKEISRDMIKESRNPKENKGLPKISEWTKGKYPEIKHQIIKIDGLSSLLDSALVEGGKEVPEGHYESENMKDTVVPNRNKIFSSIIQAVALSTSTRNNCEVGIAMGIHAGDHQVYLDCREEFRNLDFQAFQSGNWGSDKIFLYTPYLQMKKDGILADGRDCCEKLGLDFNEVYKRTNTSYKPIYCARAFGNDPQGKWYSDYKSASSVERIEAFIKLGLKDPVEYANEFGPVSWEVAKEHVEGVLQK